MLKSTESISRNGFEAHEDESEKIMNLSMRKLLEKESGNHDERNNSSIVPPLSKEREAVEAQLSQKREQLRQLQEKTEELKRMADEAHRKAEEEQTKLEKISNVDMKCLRTPEKGAKCTNLKHLLDAQRISSASDKPRALADERQ
ncbi:hypothetical protein HPB52_000694 [Rhipicephalus sanguineus]|uniref:Uncharacterized protein n=1 Tax=Rhipicephalus sanguineus TaxID=34632 RepID=A0A9D4SPX1_RHISA|nr:hypothetical protein HPB52_000694 [Rhipicephalus sanguineus]